MVTWYYCPDDAGLLAAIQNEWTSLEPVPSSIVLQPDTGWVYASVPTVAMADDQPRLHDVILLGTPVQIRATAATYTWTWGDGARTITDDPGSPYPGATNTHTYLYYEGPVDIGLTTTWTGEYSIRGGPWIDFTTTISTDTTPVPIDVLNPHHHLVDCQTGENCTIQASG